MRKTLLIIAVVFALIVLGIIGYFSYGRLTVSQDISQNFRLKIGEKAVYKGEFDLEFELMEIGKIKDILKNSRFSQDDLRNIVDGECLKEDCSDVKESTYYVVKVKNLSWDVCGEKREVLLTNREGRRMSSYHCPDMYVFKLDASASSDKEAWFSVEYSPVVPA